MLTITPRIQPQTNSKAAVQFDFSNTVAVLSSFPVLGYPMILRNSCIIYRFEASVEATEQRGTELRSKQWKYLTISMFSSTVSLIAFWIANSFLNGNGDYDSAMLMGTLIMSYDTILNFLRYRCLKQSLAEDFKNGQSLIQNEWQMSHNPSMDYTPPLALQSINIGDAI